MTGSLLTSRRSFLKALGVGAAMAAIPAPVMQALAPQVAPAAALPPNVLHVWADRGWCALGGVSQVSAVERCEAINASSAGAARVAWMVAAPPLLEVGLVGHEHGDGCLAELMCEARARKFALSMSGAAFEFDAFLSRLTCDTLSMTHPLGATCPKLDLDVVDRIEVRRLS